MAKDNDINGKDLSPEFLTKMSTDELNRLVAESGSASNLNNANDIADSIEEAVRKQREYLQGQLNAIIPDTGGDSQAAVLKPSVSMAEEIAGGKRGVIVNKTPDAISEEEEVKTSEEEAKERAKTLKDAEDDLQKLTGLEAVKKQVSELQATIAANQVRKKLGMLDPKDPESGDVSVHVALLGAPGTGKTTVARIYARLLRGIGLLKKGHLVETDRSGLVAEYQGQTAPKTNKVIDSALDGVLFIDEAYNLNTGEQDVFGQEAVATLMKRMEDDRDRLVVIIAGYTDVTEHFLDSNPGLRSRFVEKIEFPNYKNDELVTIAERKALAKGVMLTDDNKKSLTEAFEELRTTEAFANGRTARVIIDNAIKAQSLRFTMYLNDHDKMTDDEKKKFLSSFTKEDLDTAASKTIDMSTSKQSEKSKLMDEKVKLAEAFERSATKAARDLHTDADTVSSFSKLKASAQVK